MNKLLAVLIFFFVAQAGALPSQNSFCLQLYQPGSLYPMICLDGIYNEIGRFKMSAVQPSSAEVLSCSVHYATSGDLVLKEGLLEVLSNGGEKMEIRFESEKKDFSEGTATFPSGTELKFYMLSDVNTKKAFNAIYASDICN